MPLIHLSLPLLILQVRQPASTGCASPLRSCTVSLESLASIALSAWLYISTWWTARSLHHWCTQLSTGDIITECVAQNIWRSVASNFPDKTLAHRYVNPIILYGNSLFKQN